MAIETVKPEAAQVGDLIQRMQAIGHNADGIPVTWVPNPGIPTERIISAGPRRLVCELVSGPLRGQKSYRQRGAVTLRNGAYRIVRPAGAEVLDRTTDRAEERKIK